MNEKKNGEFAGTWYIYEMEQWDENDFNMEIQAYVRIGRDGMGEFQFGLVSGQIDGAIVKDNDGERFEFTWEGVDEMDSVSGSGWLRLEDRKTIEGRIRFHLGDSSWFLAKRAK